MSQFDHIWVVEIFDTEKEQWWPFPGWHSYRDEAKAAAESRKGGSSNVQFRLAKYKRAMSVEVL